MSEFGKSSTAEDVTSGIDLSGKLAFVTGVNSGIGFETMRVLAMRGAHVIGTARTLAKATEAAAQVQGELQEIWVNVGSPSQHCTLPAEPIPDGLDWDLWLGPAPWAPYNRARLNFRAWRDYSGGGMTDWGAHGFGGALFCANLHETGPVEIIPPDGKDHPQLTYVFANGVRFYHGGGDGGILTCKGTKGKIAGKDSKQPAPGIIIPNYKGSGGLIGDFLHCVRTRQRPFRDIAIAHRTVTVCHLGNLAYWLNRPLKWDPVKQEIIGDEEASRWLSRPMRAPWQLS